MDNGNESKLDDIVHDIKSQETSAINNSGIDAQILYLIASGFSRREIDTILDTKQE